MSDETDRILELYERHGGRVQRGQEGTTRLFVLELGKSTMEVLPAERTVDKFRPVQ